VRCCACGVVWCAQRIYCDFAEKLRPKRVDSEQDTSQQKGIAAARCTERSSGSACFAAVLWGAKGFDSSNCNQAQLFAKKVILCCIFSACYVAMWAMSYDAMMAIHYSWKCLSSHVRWFRCIATRKATSRHSLQALYSLVPPFSDECKPKSSTCVCVCVCGVCVWCVCVCVLLVLWWCCVCRTERGRERREGEEKTHKQLTHICGFVQQRVVWCGQGCGV